MGEKPAFVTNKLPNNTLNKSAKSHKNFIDKNLLSPCFFRFLTALCTKVSSGRPTKCCDCDTVPSCQAGDVLSQTQNRCCFSYTAICSKTLLSPSDTAHPTKTSCSHRQCCPGSRQDMIQDVVSHCCQRITNWWHSHKHFIILIGQLRFLFYLFMSSFTG